MLKLRLRSRAEIANAAAIQFLADKLRRLGVGGTTDQAITQVSDALSAIEAGGGCPCCGATASPEHMAEKHPEARKPHGTAYEAPSRAFEGGAGVREGGDRTRVLGASQAAA